jgi:hypothetical protein
MLIVLIMRGSGRALNEAIRSFHQSVQTPPFVIVATTHVTPTVVPDSHQRSNAASTAAALEVLRLPSIFRAEPNSDEYGSTEEPSWLYHAQEPSLLPGGLLLTFPLSHALTVRTMQAQNFDKIGGNWRCAV